MIEYFILSNYMSYKDETELSFLASKKEGTTDATNAMWYKEIGGKRLLKLLIGVGLNASGKTKMISALSYLRKIATIRLDNPNNKPVYRPFKLDPDSASKPTEMRLAFYIDDVRFEYYVSVSRDRIEEEELKMTGSGISRSQRIYYRQHDSKTNTVDIQFGSACDMPRRDQRELEVNIFSNATVLGQFGFMNLESNLLRQVYDYFLNRISRVHQSDQLLVDKLETGEDDHDSKMKYLLLKLLKDIGSNIVDYHIETIGISIDDFVKSGAPSALIEILKEQVTNGVYKQKILMFDHSTPLGNAPLDLQSESQGTIDIIKLMTLLYDVVIGKKCACIDEIADSLHPTALEYLLRAYLEISGECQIILMTHNLSLLSPSKLHLRRDSLRKFSKNKYGVTTVSRPEYLHRTVSLYNKYIEELGGVLPSEIKSDTMPKEYKEIL